MLACLAGRVGVRKLRLFACACCRAVWPLLPDPRSRKAVEVAERYADGLATARQLHAASQSPYRGVPPRAHCGMNACRPDAADAANHAPWDVATDDGGSIDLGIRHAQAVLLRDVVPGPGGSAGRRAPPWPTRDVLAVARAAYRGRRPDGTLEPDALAALSDALEEAGCRDAPLLFHLRGLVRDHAWAHYHPAAVADRAAYVPRRGPHVRGCWALDVVLGLAGPRG
jgi:hypothetical protein